MQKLFWQTFFLDHTQWFWYFDVIFSVSDAKGTKERSECVFFIVFLRVTDAMLWSVDHLGCVMCEKCDLIHFLWCYLILSWKIKMEQYSWCWQKWETASFMWKNRLCSSSREMKFVYIYICFSIVCVVVISEPNYLLKPVLVLEFSVCWICCRFRFVVQRY